MKNLMLTLSLAAVMAAGSLPVSGAEVAEAQVTYTASDLFLEDEPILFVPFCNLGDRCEKDQ